MRNLPIVYLYKVSVSKGHLGKVCVPGRGKGYENLQWRKRSTITSNNESQGLRKGTSHSHVMCWSGVVVVVYMCVCVSICLYMMHISHI